MSTVEDRLPLNQVQYPGRDFPSLFDAVMRRQKVEHGDLYNDLVATSVGIMLVDLMCYAVAQLNWYLSRQASDTYIDTARTRGAMARLVEQIGYKMSAATSASTDLTCTFTDGIPGSGTLSQGFQFEGPSNLVFEAVANTSLVSSPAGTEVTVAVRQGETRQLVFTSDGEENQRYFITGLADDEWIADLTVAIWVDNEEWDEEVFLKFEKTNHFMVSYVAEPPYVQFGDGIAGNIPTIGAEIRLQFVVCKGEVGNASSGSIDKLLSTLTIAGSEVAFTCTNAEKATGGNEPESLENARALAPTYYAARDCAVTKNDYRALVNSFSDSQYGSVAKGYANVVRSTDDDPTTQGYIDDVKLEVLTYANSVASEEASLDASFATMSGYVTDLTTSKDQISSDVSDLVTSASSLKSDAQSARGYLSGVISLSNQIDTRLLALDALINTVADATLKANLLAESARIDALNVSLGTDAASANSLAASIEQEVVDTVEVKNTSIQTEVAAQAGDLSSLSSEISTADSTAAVIVSGSSTMKDNVYDLVDDWADYLSTLFDADCKSNVVVVPILTLDSDGFYAAPSSGLIEVLQTYLNERKEVTHLVQVVSGVDNLVAAVVVVYVKLAPGYVRDEVLASLSATVDRLLKGRDFEEPLYLSDMYSTVEDEVVGISYINMTISGPASYLDARGNLVPGSHQIVTKGSVSITEVV